MTITLVATTAQLILAISGATTGDVIKLAPGSYSNVGIYNEKFSVLQPGGPSQIYIQSADPNNQAVLTDFNFSNSQGFNLQNLKLSTIGDATGPYGAARTMPFIINQSSNISMRSLTVSGDPMGTLDTQLSSLYLRSSTYVHVDASSFDYLHQGIEQFGDNHVTITNNSFNHLFDDGIRGGGTSNITISGNTFTNQHPDSSDTEHADAIQFWTDNTTSSASNISIMNNTYLRGSGGAAQGIFIDDKAGNPYKNLTITGNNLTGTSYNGIAVYDAPGVIISKNIITSYPDYTTYIRVYNTTGGSVNNNSAGAYTYYGSTNITQSNNLITGPVPFPTDLQQSSDLSISGDLRQFSLQSGLAVSSAAPEPETWAFMALGFSVLGMLVRTRRRAPGPDQGMAA